ncbi:hypothetical protein HYFRA_00005597 [Hymenoscyphus fraxineus]|uniref:Uncharacterized protein n=1 Tax=Hymenoscyphus fraxineus TaxID=746836 RepID=A0A9N9KSC3_9HELO|nr:hypothetical protein HYFRA_00005597 [Hymenoscyphus fraxineus]
MHSGCTVQETQRDFRSWPAKDEEPSSLAGGKPGKPGKPLPCVCMPSLAANQAAYVSSAVATLVKGSTTGRTSTEQQKAIESEGSKQLKAAIQRHSSRTLQFHISHADWLSHGDMAPLALYPE